MKNYWDAFLEEFPYAKNCTLESVLEAFYNYMDKYEGQAREKIPGILKVRDTQ